MTNTRTVHDPFLGKDVEVSDNLVDRLRGKYAQGPTMPNGEPEFGWRQFPTPPIQVAAADEIERLRALVPAKAEAEVGVREITDEMLNAHLKATNEWIEPHEAETECGVAIECGLTQEDADELNAGGREQLRRGYAAALANLPAKTERAAVVEECAQLVTRLLQDSSIRNLGEALAKDIRALVPPLTGEG